MPQITGPGSIASANDAVTNNVMAIARNHTMIISGTASAQNVVLEGSADGTTWFILTLTAASNGATVTTNAATTNGIFVATSTVPLQFVRARLVSITGGPLKATVISS